MALFPTFGNQVAPWLSGNSDTLLATGLGLLSGRTAQEQAGQAASNFANERQRAKMTNQTLAYLRQNNPDLAQAVESGAMPAGDAFKLAYQQKLEAQKPKNYSFQSLADGTYGTFDDQTGTFNPLGKAPKEQKAPTVQEFFDESTGLPYKAQFNPSTGQYERVGGVKAQSGLNVTTNPDGTVSVTQGPQAKSPKLTEAEGRNSGFYLRANKSQEILNNFEGEGTSFWNNTAGKMPVFGNYLRSQDSQKYDQAKRDFINAQLRRESGAVISPEEYANADQQYFPQPGDGPEVIAQKRQNRDSAIAGLKIGSGPGAATVDQMQPAPSNGGATSSGVKWSIEP